MSTHAQHEHGEETEKLQPENTATEAPQTTRHSAVTSPSTRAEQAAHLPLPHAN